MPTIRIQDWTKDELENLKEQKDHTSMDSVIRSPLKEHHARQNNEQK